MSKLSLPFKLVISRFYAIKHFYQKTNNVPIVSRKTRRIQPYVQSPAESNTVAADEADPETSARVETLELNNVSIKPSKKMALPKANTSAMIEVSI